MAYEIKKTFLMLVNKKIKLLEPFRYTLSHNKIKLEDSQIVKKFKFTLYKQLHPNQNKHRDQMHSLMLVISIQINPRAP